MKKTKKTKTVNGWAVNPSYKKLVVFRNRKDADDFIRSHWWLKPPELHPVTITYQID